MSERICMALDLKDDSKAISTYEKYHKEVWPEVVESIKDAGIEDMQIYRTGNRLFMIMEVSDSFDPELKAKMDSENEKVQEWEQLMSTMQQKLPWASEEEKWVQMDKIYQLI